MTGSGVSAWSGGVVAGTLVHTYTGLKPIEQVQVGDRVLTRPEGSKGNVWRAVRNTFVKEDSAIQSLTLISTEGMEPTRLCYLADDQALYVAGQGWTGTDQLKWGRLLELYGAKQADVYLRWPVWRTPAAGFGWVACSERDPDEVGFVVDFRGGANLWEYDVAYTYEGPARYVEADIDFIGEFAPIRESADPRLKVRVHSLEVEEFHAYFVGEIGVWLRDAVSLT